MQDREMRSRFIQRSNDEKQNEISSQRIYQCGSVIEKNRIISGFLLIEISKADTLNITLRVIWDSLCTFTIILFRSTL